MKKKKVVMYYTYGDRVGGPLTYINTIMNSELNEDYEFATCFQNMGAGGINLTLLRRMIQKLKEEKPDIVHVHGLQSEGLYGVLAAKFAGCKKIVVTVHGFSFDSQSISKRKRFMYRYFVEPATIRMADKVYCVCDYAAQREIIKRNAKRNNCGYIWNAVPDFKITESREDLRKRLKIKNDDTVFVISGRISREKGFDVLAQSMMSKRLKDNNNYKLLVIGDGDYSQTFCETLKDEVAKGKVIMAGKTDRVGDYLNASDVFILPSYHENLPIAVIEAGKMGLPCIISNAGGMPEIIVDNRTGFVICGWNPEDYAEKMELLLSNTELRRDMSRAIKKDVNDRFDISKMCKKIREVYE